MPDSLAETAGCLTMPELHYGHAGELVAPLIIHNLESYDLSYHVPVHVTAVLLHPGYRKVYLDKV